MSRTSRRMRVLLVTTSYPLTGDSVSGVFVARLVESLLNLVDVRVLTPADGQHCGWLKVNGVDVYAFAYAPSAWRQLAHGPGGILAALRRNPLYLLLVPFLLLILFWHILRLASWCDVIHANWSINGLVSGFASKLCRRPVLTTLRGSDVTRAKGGWLDKWIVWLCCHLNQQLIAVSAPMINWLQDSLGSAVLGRVQLIENGVAPCFLKVLRKPSQTCFELLAVSSLIPAKGLVQLIDVLPLLNSPGLPVRLTIVGDGEMRETLLLRAEEKGVAAAVKLSGALTHERIAECMASAHVFVFCSYAEGRPNVVLEAMAAGLPIVSTDIEGVSDLLDDEENALLYVPDDVPELAGKINRLIQSATLRQSLAASARTKVIKHGWTWEATAAKYHACYLSLVEADFRSGSCAD